MKNRFASAADVLARLPVAPVFAREPSAVEPAIVTATRKARTVDETLAAGAVVTREEIDRTQAQTLPQPTLRWRTTPLTGESRDEEDNFQNDVTLSGRRSLTPGIDPDRRIGREGLGVSIVAQGARYPYDPDVHVPGDARLDLRHQRELTTARWLRARIENAPDRDCETADGYDMPDRMFFPSPAYRSS